MIPAKITVDGYISAKGQIIMSLHSRKKKHTLWVSCTLRGPSELVAMRASLAIWCSQSYVEERVC